MPRRRGWYRGFRRFAGDEDLIEAGEIDEVIPARYAGFDVVDHALAKLGAAQPLEEFVGAAVVRPWRQDDAKHGASGNVGILIEGSADSFRCRAVEQSDDLVDEGPVFAAADLEVGEVDLHAGPAPDLDDFFHGGEDGVRFAALMHDEGAIELRDDLA